MKQLKRTLCLLLATCLLFLAACNRGGKDGDSATDRPGRYVETDITPPIDGWLMSFQATDGTLVCFSSGLQTRYDSTDGGETWVESPGPARNSAANAERYMSVRTGTLLPDGNLLAYIQNEGLVIIAPDGSSTHYPIAEIDKAAADEEFVSLSLIQSLGNDRLLLGYLIGGISIQGGRPIGQPNQAGGTPVVGEPAQPDGPGQPAQPAGPASGGPQYSSTPVTVNQEVTIGGPQQANPGYSPVDGPDAQGSEPQDSESQGTWSQNTNPQRGSGSVNMGIGTGSMIRKTALYELSTGRQIAELPDENAVAATADNENVYVMDMQGSIKAYSLTDGSGASRTAVNLGSSGGNMFAMPGLRMGGGVLAAVENGSLYAIYDGDLLLCGAGGDIDTVLEGTAYSIGAPNSNASSVFILNDGSIIVNMLENMDSARLYRYKWDENAGINPDKTLTVWSLEENAFVRAAISELRKKNPDSYITYEIATGGGNAISATDAINTLNTRLLGGSGPDIIILDGCPAESYAGKGVLMDLSGLVDTSGVYQNLLSPYVNDGKMFYLPTQFFVPVLIGNTDALNKARTLSDLVQTVVSGNDTPVLRPGGGGPFGNVAEDERSELYFEDLEELCNVMWMSGAPAIVKDNKLDTDALGQYLSAIKEISDKLGLEADEEENSLGIAVAFSSGGRATALTGSLVRYTSQMTNYGAYPAGHLMLLQLTMDRGGSDMALFPGLVRGAWRPSTIAGISADTDVAGFAAEFIRTMLSVEVQRINYNEGLPVTMDGMAAQIQTMNDMLVESERDPFSFDMDSLIKTLAEPSVNDTVLTDMMWPTVEKLCRGGTDVNGAVREIEQNIKNYLAERA